METNWTEASRSGSRATGAAPPPLLLFPIEWVDPANGKPRFGKDDKAPFGWYQMHW